MCWLHVVRSLGHVVWKHARIQKVLSEGVQIGQLFLVDEGWEDRNTTPTWVIIEPPAKRHLYGVSLAGRWWPNIECWHGSFVIFRGSGPVLLSNPIFFDFSGGSGPLPSLWIRPWKPDLYWPRREKTCRLRGFANNRDRRRPACASAQSDQRLCYSLFGKFHM